MKVYSGLSSIPRKKASGTVTEGCMALEGGAFRGLYTSGVLDVLMEHGINMRTTVGVSAGALNGVNYTSGQIGRSAICNLKYRHYSKWVGLKAFQSDNGIIGFDFLQKDFLKEYPFDEIGFFGSGRHFIAAATSLETGLQEYFDSADLTMDKVYTSVAASASMPLVSKPVEINGGKYLDGGCSFKLPIRWALEQGFEKVVFVGTNISSMRRSDTTALDKLFKVRYSKYPAFLDALLSSNIRYNEDCDMMDQAVAEGRMFRISPSEPVTVSRLEGDMEKLGALYHLGRSDAEAQLPALTEYLNL